MDRCGGSIVSEITWHEPFKLGDTTSATYLKLIHLKSPTEDKGIQPSESLPAGNTSELGIMDYGMLCFTAQTAALTVRRAEEESRDPGVTRKRTVGGDTSTLLWMTIKRRAIAMFAWVRNYFLRRAVVGDGGANEDKVKRDERGGGEMPVDYWTEATIYSPIEERVGTLSVPLGFFNENSERSGEFVLLSSNAQNEADEICKKVAEGCDIGCLKHVHGCKHILSRNIMLIEWDGDVAFRRGLTRVKKASWEKVETQTKKIILG